MFRENEEKNIILFTISSELEYVDRILNDSVTFIKKHNIEKINKIKTVLRELLINAIEHGNKNQIDKEVKCSVELIDKCRIRITVKDSGIGFNYNAINYKMPKHPNQQRNRGLAIVNAMTDDIVFNESGNKITVYITFVTITEFEVKEVENQHIIIPDGDLTASCSDKCRTLLLEMLDNKVENYCFDFQKVEDVDSISLSLLITFSQMVKKRFEKAELAIVNVNEDLMSLFNLTKMDKVYRIAGNS